MTNDALQFITYFPSLIWQLFTGFKIPGLNMTPAIFFFGVLSFSLAFKFLMGVINISTSGFNNYEVRQKSNYAKVRTRITKGRE
jgi:hypothetical protein